MKRDPPFKAVCSSEDPAAADESSTTQESPIAVRGFQPQCHLPRPAAPAGVTHAVQGAGSTGELRELLSYLQCASCWFALTDTAYLENVLFVRGGEYFISWQHSEFHLTMVHVTLQRIWASSTLYCFLPHLAIWIFSSQIAFIGPKIHSRSSLPNTVQVNKPEISCQLEGERGISWKAVPSIHPCLCEKGNWQNKV